MYGLLPSSELVQRCTVPPSVRVRPPAASADAARLRSASAPPRDLVLLAESAAFPEYLFSFVLPPPLVAAWINPTDGNAILHARKRRYKSCLIIREHGAARTLEIAVSRRRRHFSSHHTAQRGVRPIEWIGGAHEWLASCSLSGRVKIVHLPHASINNLTRQT